MVPSFGAELDGGAEKKCPGSREHSYHDHKWDGEPEGHVRVLTDLHLGAGQIYTAG